MYPSPDTGRTRRRSIDSADIYHLGNITILIYHHQGSTKPKDITDQTKKMFFLKSSSSLQNRQNEKVKSLRDYQYNFVTL